MDILLVDPPYTSLKNIATKRGYHVGLTSLAAYLRQGGIDSAVLMGDLITGLSAYDSVLHTNVKTYAKGQHNYESIVNNKNHVVWKKIADVINQSQPKIVGISYLTPLKCVVERVAQIVKDLDKGIKVVVGSFHPTFCPQEVMQNPNIDFIITGEGEIPLLHLVRELKKDIPNWDGIPGIYYRDKSGQVKSTSSSQPISDLDTLPFLARDLVLNCDFDSYRIHSIYTSRGCPYSCAFCSDRGFWRGQIRRRSVNNVIEELQLIKSSFKKIDYIDIVDGTFTFDRRYLFSFCTTMMTRKIDLKWRCTARYDNLDKELLEVMKQAGCSGLYLGAETGSDRLLSQIDKRISTQDIYRVSQMVFDSGILSATAILLGLPDEGREDAQETLKLMKKVKTDIFDINSYIPLPGTELFTSVTEEEKRSIDWAKIGYKSYDNYFSKRMSRQSFTKYRSDAYKISNSLQRKTVIRLGLKIVINNITGRFKKIWSRPRQRNPEIGVGKPLAQ